MKKINVLFFIFIASISTVHSQIRFQKTYGGTGNDVAWKVLQTSDHGYLICGYTTSFGNGMEDAYIIKTDSIGIKQWSKTIGGDQNDEAYSAIEDNGSYVIGGITYSYGAGSRDGFLARLDLSGNIIWFKTYGTPNQDYNIFRFNKTLDNGFIIAYTLNNSSYQYSITKTNSTGNIIWSQSYGGASTNVAGDVIQCPDSSFIASGFTNGFGSGQHDFLISRANSLGNILWSKTLGTGSDEGGSYYLTYLNNNQAFITGQVNNFQFGPDNIVYLKINYLTGNIIWEKTYGKAGKTLRAFSGTPTQDNGFASDIHDYTASTNHDMGILRTDSIGNILWVKKYGGSGDDIAYSICNTTDNGFALAGSTTSFGNGGKDIYLVKTDFQGKSSFINNCNETSDTLNQGTYVNNPSSPNIPEVVVTNEASSASILSSNSSDSAFAMCSCPPVSLGAFSSVCENTGPFLLSGGAPTGGTYSGPGISGGTFNPAIAGLGIHTISYNYSDVTGCSGTATEAITVNPLPTAAITPAGPLSICGTGSVTLSANTGAGYSYQWYLNNAIIPGATSSQFIVNSVGSYKVQVTLNGCSSFSQVVDVLQSNSGPVVTITSSAPLGCQNGIYIGYGIQSDTLTANAPGAVSYLWSNGSTSQSIIVSSPGIFSVTAWDASGCESQQTNQSQITVVDIRCGNNLNKVILCHVPPGNPGNSQTICIAPQAVPAHLANHPGDCLGPCSSTQRLMDPTLFDNEKASVYPNPFNHSFMLHHDFDNGEPVQMIIRDITGRIIESFTKVTNDSEFGINLSLGIYLVEIFTPGKKEILKVTKIE